MGATCLAWALLAAVPEPAIWSDRPNAVVFPAQDAKFVRFLIHASSSNEPCVDELEVYGPDGNKNLALAEHGAQATASSCLPGYPQHAIEHLNDGLYGNQHSWIAAGTGTEWAQIELPGVTKVSKVVFSRDREREYADRVPIQFEIQLSLDGTRWSTVKEISAAAAPVAVRKRSGGFSGLVPSPPPPPQIAADGRVISGAGTAEIKVPRQDGLGFANLALGPAARPEASSLLPGYPIHQIAHLNDGLAGNRYSWISRAEPSWAQIDLGDVYWVYCVAFGSDSSRQYQDRAATRFSILAARRYNADSGAATWKPVYRHSDGSPVHVRREFQFPPVEARWIRVAIEAAHSGQVRIDELEIYGQKEPIPEEKIGVLLARSLPAVRSQQDVSETLQYAFLGEEHAWLKTYGRADLSPRLVPYNGRVKEYPRHAGEDRLPLPPLGEAPNLDGRLDDRCWTAASRGTVRVAWPYDFDRGPVASFSVAAGWHGEHLYLAILADRLLSSHVAVISQADGRGCGVVALTSQGLVFNTYEPEGPDGATLKDSAPIQGAFDRSLRAFEFRLPLAAFPDWRAQGVRVGLGMGGKHTPREGRAVHFHFSPLWVAELGPCVDRTFQVCLGAASGAPALCVKGNLSELADGLTLQPGQSKVLSVPAQRGPIGPQYTLEIEDPSGERYLLHLFRYDPLERTLALMEQMIDRLGAKGLDLSAERAQLAELRRRQAALSAEPPDLEAERRVFFEARLAKRRLFLREPDLAPIEKILFVKRHAYEPSHNYSALLDAPWRPGGGIYLLEIPRREGRFEPGESRVRELFGSGSGLARDPVPNFDLSRIYFAYRASESDYFHLMSMGPDGRDVKQLTGGPFHDFFPCPLPDGGLAFISTRCKSRYLCWRPQAFVLFRMDADGSRIWPLSYANLSEWNPSVTRDGRIIWTRSEYIDKGADFSHTLWTIRPDGTQPELVFGNTIIQPNGYTSGREVPGTSEVCCTLISHFGDLNGPIALVDPARGRFNPKAITSLTPEVPWPGMWPEEECFRDPYPIARDYFLCSHAPRRQFGLYVIDRFGNRELLYQDLEIGSMAPAPLRAVVPPPVLAPLPRRKDTPEPAWGQLVLADVYRGIEHAVPRGTIKYLRVVEEVRAGLEQLPNGHYRKDHEPFMHFYASPVDVVSGPYGWPSYVAKAPWGLAPVESDGSAHFYAPAGKTLYFQALDKDLNEVQRMRSVVQVQPGETRSCIGCHEDRRHAPPARGGIALRRPPSRLEPPPWGAGPLAYERVVQPVWDRRCVQCHNAHDKHKIDLTAALDPHRVPASYRTLIQQGWVHVLDCGWNSGGNEKRQPYTFGTFQSRLWKVLDAGHYGAELTRDEMHAVKCWIDMNCPLWPDYIERSLRPGPQQTVTRKG
ncbi:MAG: HzsA-related protein [Thermoguttaceae bacterium]